MIKISLYYEDTIDMKMMRDVFTHSLLRETSRLL